MKTANPSGLTRRHLRRIVEVAHARGLGFVELVGLAELDPATAFRGAVFQGTALKGQNLAGFDLTGATLSGCDLTGTDLSRTAGITAAMLDGAIVDETTRLVPNLRKAICLALARRMTADLASRPASVAAPLPSWAFAGGVDAFGTWAEIGITGRDNEVVVQRMRLIPPGRFLMGSPEYEPGRYDDEGPQHSVTIAEGFWLFDTPCTQVFWEAVMGGNPSRFKSPTRPVETVSFDDVQRFLANVNQRVQGLNLTLPSEAKWEYACRAGTATATYAGPINILGTHNAPILDDIAWYGGNSGIEFELGNGDDSNIWMEKQYNHAVAGTHPVKCKAPNSWGLFDMLGNVWEWCQDHEIGNYEGAQFDGGPRLGGNAARRVVRGGAWRTAAGSVRAASRSVVAIGGRNYILSFRCARDLGANDEATNSAPARRRASGVRK